MIKEEANLRTINCQAWLRKRTLCAFQFCALVYDTVKNKGYAELGYKSGLEWWLDNFPFGRRNYFVYKGIGKEWKKLLQFVPESLFDGLVFERIIAALPQLKLARTKEDVVRIVEAIKTTERRKMSKALTPTLEGTMVLAELRGGQGRMSHIQYNKEYLKVASTQNIFETFGNKEVEFMIRLKKRDARKKRA